MPRYEFKCDLGHDTVIVQSIHDPLPKTCLWQAEGDEQPCGAHAEQQFGKAPASHFKGGGWTPKFHE